MTPIHHRPPRTSAGRRRTPALLGTGAAVVLAASAASPALAHDELLTATPDAGDVLTEAPQELTLVFSGEITTGTGIQNLAEITDASGQQVAGGDLQVQGDTVVLPIEQDLDDGQYDVAFRVVYSDGHAEQKEYAFTVDTGQGPAAEATQDAGAAETTSDDAAATAAAEPAEAGAADQADSGSGDSAAQGGSAAAGDGAAEAGEADSTEAATEAAARQDQGGFPAWGWALAIGGVAVIAAGAVLMARRPQS